MKTIMHAIVNNLEVKDENVKRPSYFIWKVQQ